MDRFASRRAHRPTGPRPSAPPRGTEVYASAHGIRGRELPPASAPRPSTPRPPPKLPRQQICPAPAGSTVYKKDSVPYRPQDITPRAARSIKAFRDNEWGRRGDGYRVAPRNCDSAERQRRGLTRRELRYGGLASYSKLRRTRGSLTLHTIDAERLRTFPKSQD